MPRAKLEAKEEPAAAAGLKLEEAAEEAAEEPAAKAATKPATAAKSSFGGNTFFPGKGSSPYGKGGEEGFPGKGKDSFNKGKSKGWEEGFAFGKGKDYSQCWDEAFANGKGKGFSEGLAMGRTLLFQDLRKLAALRRGLESLENEMEERLKHFPR